jgi:surfeit locus 1 family protein
MFKRIALVPSIAALLVVTLTVNLGAWQLRRADEKRALVQQREAAQKEPAVTWEQWNKLRSEAKGALPQRQLRLSGEFVADKTVFLDNRSVKGVAGMYALTPMRIGTDTYVMILRGWMAHRAGERNTMPTVTTPSGTQELVGLVQADLGKAAMFSANQNRTMQIPLWAHVDLADYSKASGLNLAPMVLRQFSDTPDGLQRQWPLAANEIDKHLGYAFQWFALALTTLALWLYFALIRPSMPTGRETLEPQGSTSS